MTKEQTDALKDVVNSLEHLVEVAKQAQQPTRAILISQVFIIIQKVRWILDPTA